MNENIPHKYEHNYIEASKNTVVGWQAGSHITTGENNVFIGIKGDQKFERRLEKDSKVIYSEDNFTLWEKFIAWLKGE